VSVQVAGAPERAKRPRQSTTGALALLACMSASCATGQASASPNHGASTPAIRQFDNRLLEGVATGCLYDRRPVSSKDTSTSGEDAASLVQQNARAWTATLTWGEAADAHGTTQLTFSFADVRTLTEVVPRPDPTAKGAPEVQCNRYVELLGTLHVETRDGRWQASFPASLQAHSTGDTIVTISDRPLQFFGAPWSSALGQEERAILFTELTTAGAAGELRARGADGADRVAASWR
jgi:hypothetical protein